jgi:antitoxin component YwqK of YwqJK toxin-antitoxin module
VGFINLSSFLWRGFLYCSFYYLGEVKMKQNEEVKVEYYWNGNKKSEIHYKDGKEDGVFTLWYDDGIKEYEQHFVDGKQDGVFTLWNKLGTKINEGHWKDGKENDVWTWWNEHGTIQMEYHWKDGAVVKIERFGFLNSKKDGELVKEVE